MVVVVDNGKNPIHAMIRPTRNLDPIPTNTKMGKTLPFTLCLVLSVWLWKCEKQVVGKTLPRANCPLDISRLFIIRQDTLRVAAATRLVN